MNIQINKMRTVCLLLFLACCFMSSFNQVLARSIEDYLQKAEEYLQDNKLKSAVLELKNVLQKDESNKDARFLLGRTYLRFGAGIFAEKEFRKAVRYGMPEKRIRILLARAYLQQGKLEDLIKESVVHADMSTEELAIVRALQARAFLRLNNIEKAEDLLARALYLDPDVLDVHLGLGQLALHKRQIETAHHHIKHVYERSPKHVDAHLFMGQINRIYSKFAESRENFKFVLSVQPENRSAHLGLIATLIGLGKIDEADAYVAKFHKDNVEDVELNYLRAVIAFQKQDLTQTHSILRTILRKDAEHGQSLHLLGTVYFMQNDFKEANTAFLQYLKNNSLDMMLSKLLAITYLKLDQEDQSIKILEDALRLTPLHPELMALLGTAYFQKQDFAKSFSYFTAAVAAAPDNTMFKDQLLINQLVMTSTNPKHSVEQKTLHSNNNLLSAFIALKEKQYDKALKITKVLKMQLPRNALIHQLEGSILAGQGNIKAAEEQYKLVLAINPKHTQAELSLGRLLVKQGKIDKAKAHYKKILNIDSNHVDAMLELAQLAEKVGNVDETMDWLQRAAVRNPTAIRPRVFLAQYHLYTGALQDALKVIKQAQNIAPNDHAVLKVLGIVQQKNQLLSDAAMTFKTLTQLHPNSAEFMHLLASVQIQQKQYDAAAMALVQALQRDSDYLPAKKSLVMVKLYLNLPADALQIAEEMQQANPNSSVAYQLMGSIYDHEKDYKLAIKFYELAYKIDATADLARKLSVAYEHQGNVDTAIAVLKRWLANNPADVALRLHLADVYEKKGAVYLAIEQIRLLLEYDKNNVTTLVKLATLYQQQGDRRSIEIAQLAYSLAREQPEVQDTLGWLLVLNGQNDRGLELLLEASKNAAHSSTIRFHLAVALHNSGNNEDARVQLERVLQTDRNFPEVKEAEKLYKKLAGTE